MYVNINIERRFDLLCLAFSDCHGKESTGGGDFGFCWVQLIFCDGISTSHNYLVCSGSPEGATLSLFVNCISWKQRDIIVNIFASLYKVSVLFVCLQIKFNMFDMLIKSAAHNNFTNIYLVGAEIFYAQKQKWRSWRS
jgi:hypothetical protein